MRTKALLCCAALAVGVATSMAQSNVYSLNIVGYVNTTIGVGANLIANPLDNGTNDLNSLFPGAGFGDLVYFWNGSTFQSSTYLGSWSAIPPATTDPVLAPGTGVFYVNSGTAAFTNTFVGNVLTGSLTNHIPLGVSLKASQAPLAEDLNTLGVPGNFGDIIYVFRGGSYNSSTYLGSWSAFTAGSANLGIGEGFWFQETTAPLDWVMNFNP